MAGGPDLDDPRWLLTRTWREPGQLLHIVVDPELRAIVYFSGKGSMGGARALIDVMESIRDAVGHDKVFSAVVDLRELDGSPLRAQFLLGKWLFTRKAQLERVAIFGGRPFEMRLAQAVMKIGMMRNAGFFDTQREAIAWIGWPRDLYG
ncbi:MAG: STAS/SEC14 domain-containing protein [Deltaproteobacteria bacterium]|nr:MAG: STAS/SEC14 domain-containing protein [Deltaproteobacteria bacterium]